MSEEQNTTHNEIENEPLSTEATVTQGHTPENTKLPVVGQLVLLSALMLLIFGSTITPRIIAFLNVPKTQDTTATKNTQSEVKEVAPTKEPFQEIALTAKAAFVWDVHNQKVLFRKNETEQLPLASITKLMTALVAEEIMGEEAKIVVGETSVKQDGGGNLAQGEVFDRLTLSDMVLMASSNDGAYALAAAAGKVLETEDDAASAFVDAMNIRATEIGLTETYFKNPTGLDLSPTEGGAYGSARDVAFLMEHIVENTPDLLTFTKEDSARFYSTDGAYHDAENTNEYVNKIPGLIGSKTGYTELAGGNLVIAWNAGLGRPMVAVVLGSTQTERFSDILTLVNETSAVVR
jgi:serine-type D-Ala-D-Ala carboxypeptidase (penicillin-binding protein 5/6)